MVVKEEQGGETGLWRTGRGKSREMWYGNPGDHAHINTKRGHPVMDEIKRVARVGIVFVLRICIKSHGIRAARSDSEQTSNQTRLPQ